MKKITLNLLVSLLFCFLLHAQTRLEGVTTNLGFQFNADAGISLNGTSVSDQKNQNANSIFDTSDAIITLTDDSNDNFTASVNFEDGNHFIIAKPNLPTQASCNAASTVNSFPYVESFEDDSNNLGLWTQEENNDLIDWTINLESTPTSGTGPNGASQGNNYFYTEASLNTNSSAILNSPCFDLTNAANTELSFDYHMFGSNIGSLRVEVSVDGAAFITPIASNSNPLEGEQQTSSDIATIEGEWRTQTVNLSEFDGQIISLRITGSTGRNPLSDIAIDNINVIEAIPCAIAVPTNLVTSNINLVSATADWDDIPSATYDLRYREVGTTVFTEENDITLNTFDITQLNLDTQYEIQVRSRCTTDTSDYSTLINFTTLAVPPCTGSIISVFPYNESFEDNSNNLGLWTQEVNNDLIDWEIDSGSTSSSNTGPNGASQGNNYFYTEASGNTDSSAILNSPCFDLANATNTQLSFDYHMFGSNTGSLRVEVSVDGSAFMTPIASNPNPLEGEQQTSSDITTIEGEWRTQTVDLSEFDGQIISLRITGITGSSRLSDIAIDNISLVEFIACATTVPTNLTTSSINVVSATANWDNIPSATYDLRYREVRTTVFTEENDITLNTFDITQLAPDTQYEIQVRSRCTTDTSDYSTLTNFTTLPIPPCTDSTLSVFPYTEDFEDDSNNLGIWIQDDSDQGNWSIGEGGTSSGGTGPNGDFDPNNIDTQRIDGNYFFIEASSSATGGVGDNATVNLISPCIDLTEYTDTNFSFYYHMVGDNTGNLSVDISLDNGTTWNQLDVDGNFVMDTPILNGQQQVEQNDPWLEQNIDLNNYSGQIIRLRISATTIVGFRGDMAIDQINITANLLVADAITQNIIIDLDAEGNATITEDDVNDGSIGSGVLIFDTDITTFNCDNIGDNTVTLTVTDDTSTDTATAIVTVRDVTGPVSDVTTLTTITDECQINSMTAPTATDNCSDVITGTTTTTFPITTQGTNTVTWTFSDESGNTTTQDQDVIINDSILPVVICQDIIVELDAEGSATIASSDIDGGSTDNCSISSITASQTTFSEADLGAVTVTLTVTDDNGNIETCDALVTVTSSTLSSNDFDLINVQISPNPFNDIITIELPLRFNNTGFDIMVIDLNGRVVYKEVPSNINGIMNISGLNRLAEGPYFIRITNKEDQKTITKKMIKY